MGLVIYPQLVKRFRYDRLGFEKKQSYPRAALAESSRLPASSRGKSDPDPTPNKHVYSCTRVQQYLAHQKSAAHHQRAHDSRRTMDDSTRKQLQQIKADLDAGLIDEDQAKLLRDRALRLTLLQAPPSGAGNRNGTAAQGPATPRAATPAGPRAPAITPTQQAYLPAMNTRLLQFCVALWEGRLKLFGYKMQSAAASETFGELVQRMLLPLGKAHLINRPLKILSYQTQSERVSTQVGFDLLDEVGGPWLWFECGLLWAVLFAGRHSRACPRPRAVDIYPK